MGYKRARKTYRLKFEDPELNGFEIAMGSLTIGQFMDLQAASAAAADDAEGVTALLEKFTAKIISWNLEDDDGLPVPATFDGVKTQDMDFIMTIISAWMDAMAGVDPTSRASANGSGTFPEVSLPMEPVSASRPN